jgi:hypothetical protein
LGRILTTLLVLGLLAASAAAFVLTEALELRPSPIVRVAGGTQVLSAARPAAIDFVLRRRSRITVRVVAGDEAVRTLVRGQERPAGRVRLHWDGRGESGAPVPDGRYRVRVELARGQLRRIDLPGTLRLDGHAPRLLGWHVEPHVISPDRDGIADRAHISYTLDERARGILYVDGVRRGVTTLSRARHRIEWIEAHGVHRIGIAAVDAAGNESKPVRVGTVVVRFVTLARHVMRVAPRARFQVTVSSDHPRLSWSLGAGHGTFRGHVLRLVAPRHRGRYQLRVGYDGHVAVALVLVGGAR